MSADPGSHFRVVIYALTVSWEGQGALARRAGYLAQTRWFALCRPVRNTAPNIQAQSRNALWSDRKALGFPALSLISSLMWNPIRKTPLMTQPSIKLWTIFNYSALMPTLSQDRDVFVLALFRIGYKSYWGVKGVMYETDFQAVEKERTPKLCPQGLWLPTESCRDLCNRTTEDLEISLWTGLHYKHLAAWNGYRTKSPNTMSQSRSKKFCWYSRIGLTNEWYDLHRFHFVQQVILSL